MKVLKSLMLTILMTISTALFAQYKIGDVATDFKLKNIDGKMVSLSDFPNAKGYIVIFTCNHCPYAKKYESRSLSWTRCSRTKVIP